ELSTTMCDRPTRCPRSPRQGVRNVSAILSRLPGQERPRAPVALWRPRLPRHGGALPAGAARPVAAAVPTDPRRDRHRLFLAPFGLEDPGQRLGHTARPAAV